MTHPIWTPSQDVIENSQMQRFMRFVNQEHGLKLNHYPALHQWSVQHAPLFWDALWRYSGVIAHQQPSVLCQQNPELNKTRWFIDAKLNFAENLLNQPDEAIALIHVQETGTTQTLEHHELKTAVRNLAHYFLAQGIEPGDTIAGLIGNNPYAVIAFLAASSIGAVWTCCAPEQGYSSCLERLQQVKPALILAQLTHHYNGKAYEHVEKIKKIDRALTPAHWIIVHNAPHAALPSDPRFQYSHAIPTTPQAIPFTPLPFDHPLVILFTSGTTGAPKCIVHGAGGTLLQHIKEHRLHTNIAPNDTLFFYTSTSWMMWNWLVSGLASGATLVLYDGAPTYGHCERLLHLIEEHGIHHFGVGAKLVETWQKRAPTKQKKLRYPTLKTILTTGSPLLPTAFDYLEQNIKSTIPICSISGGSDIISCFALGNPILPVYRGQLQCVGLGMDVRVFSEAGKPLKEQEGELVCCNAFPSMPVRFLNDPQGTRYHDAYFKRFNQTWTHGDYAVHHQNGGITILGRSDTTLNPGGIRIGTADLYRELGSIPEVVDAAAVGKKTNGDEIIVLLVVLASNHSLNEGLIKHIKHAIRAGTTPHHVPKRIFQVQALPRTHSGKLSEKAIKKILNKQNINNKSAIANPECISALSAIADQL